jgi:hypothetical protein
VRNHYCDNFLRTTIASTAIMMDHDQMAALTLKKEMPIDSKKMADIVEPLIRKKRTVAKFCYSSSSRWG